MRVEDQERILFELESRIATASAEHASGGGPKAHELLEDAIYHERRRLKDEPPGRRRQRDDAFWTGIEQLRGAPERVQQEVLRQAVRHYGEEIAGNFDERVYQVVTRAVPPVLALLLNAVSPKRLLQCFPEPPQLDDAVIIQGETEQLRRLHEIGTVILAPTHISNLDSIIVGFALYRLGLPPFEYGAGLNLFSNSFLSFFMHNLGPYTFDRRKEGSL